MPSVIETARWTAAQRAPAIQDATDLWLVVDHKDGCPDGRLVGLDSFSLSLDGSDQSLTVARLKEEAQQ